VLSTFEPGKCTFMDLGYDVTEECDCGGRSNPPIIADFGVLTGCDPVAVDSAAAEIINKASPYPGGGFSELREEKDRMKAIKPGVDWSAFLDLAASAGLGSRDHTLKTI
jgi:hypothetical protein